MSTENEDLELYRRIVTRVKVPAILLLSVGILNLFMSAGGLLREGFIDLQLTPEARKAKAVQIWNEMPEGSRTFFEKNGMGLKQWVEGSDLRARTSLTWGIVATVGGLIISWGAWQMMHLRSLKFSIFASISAAVPFLSCLGCMGIGQIVGVWSMIILFNSDVQAMFNAPDVPDSSEPSQS